MATITKTFTENGGTGNKATWTISLTASNKTVSGDFKMGLTGTAKHVVSGKGYGSVGLICDYNDYEEGNSGYSFLDRPVDSWDNVQFVSGTTYSLTNSDEREIILSSVFNSSNATSITANVTLYTTHISLSSTTNASGDGWSWYDNTNRVNWGTIATVTLNAPPQATLGTPTYQTPYAGLGVYTVPLTTLAAQYGGNIISVTLTVGTESTTQTYSAGTVSDQTISLTPSIVGTFIPTITVTDSRGQTTTITLPQITVNPYNVPSVSFDVYRTNDIGIKNDEGHYALIQSTISYTDAIATLIEPSIQIDGVDLSSLTDASVTWYKTWSNTSGVSNVISDWTTLVPQNHMVTIYGLIDWDYDTTGNFAEDTSYQITLVANDSVDGHSAPITQTMSTAFYTIDFQAGGKEIAFGAPANDDLTDVNGNDYSNEGLFKCRMHTLFEQDLNTDGDINADNIIASGNIEASGDVTVGGHSSPIGTMQVVNVTTGAIVADINTYTSGASLTLEAGSYIIYCYGSMGTNSSSPQLRAIRLYRVSPNAAGLWAWRNVFANGNWATISATIPQVITETTTLRVDASASVTANSASTWIIAMRIA